MHKHTLLNTVFALSIASAYGFAAIPALAQVQMPVPSTPNQEVTIPQSSAITITFSSPVTFDAGQKQSLPITAFLAQPLLDSNGNIVAPANSPVSVQLKPTQGGVQIQAESLVIGGRVIPIQASSLFIPGHTVTAANNGTTQPVLGNIGGSIGNILNSATHSTTDLAPMGTNVGSVLDAVLGSGSSKSVRVVEIPQGSIYILTLQAPVTVPSIAAQNSSPTQIPTSPTPTTTQSTPSPQSSP